MSETGDMAKGYGREWEVGTNGNLQILRTICLTCVPHLIDFLLHPYSFLHGTAADYTQCPIRALSPRAQQRLSRLRLLIISIRLQTKTLNRNLIVVTARSAIWGKIASFGEKSGVRPESANVDEETLARYL